jgi:uncharacterized SAM-binding protein YcdF (DUF218 family)
MKLFRIAVFVFSAAEILLNIGPFFTSGEKNIGILAGVGTGMLFLVYALFFKKINSLIVSVWHYTPGKIILCLISAILTTVIIAFCFTFINVVRYSRESDKRPEYIIVLGCKVNGTKPGRFLKLRINTAFRYLSENPGSKAILTGGQGQGEDISEGKCMRDELISLGISPDRLTAEEKSSSTYENFRNSIEILEADGIRASEIGVVTNDFHEYRAIKYAEKNGIKGYSFPAKTPRNGYLPFAVREVFAVWYQIYLGRNNLRKTGVIQ